MAFNINSIIIYLRRGNSFVSEQNYVLLRLKQEHLEEVYVVKDLLICRSFSYLGVEKLMYPLMKNKLQLIIYAILPSRIGLISTEIK